jgi:hypothetical protein
MNIISNYYCYVIDLYIGGCHLVSLLLYQPTAVGGRIWRPKRCSSQWLFKVKKIKYSCIFYTCVADYSEIDKGIGTSLGTVKL